MPRKRTNNEFIQELKIKNSNIEALEPYVNNTTKILFKCLKCGNIYKTIPKIVLNRHLCPKCGKIQQGLSSRSNQEIFIQKLREINSNIQIKSQYVLSTQKVKCKCLIDGYEWEATPNSLLRVTWLSRM